MSKDIYIIGDTHGDCSKLVRWATTARDSVLFHVGDFGMGFKANRGFTVEDKAKALGEVAGENGNIIYVIRGNHDNPSFFDGQRHGGICFVPDNISLEEGGKTFWLCGGATSVDRSERTENQTWWRGEELGWNRKAPPKTDIVITHTAGSWTGLPIDSDYLNYWYKKDAGLRKQLLEERDALDSLKESMKKKCSPKAWYYGHFHKTLHCTEDVTTFRGLAEDELIQIAFK